MQVETSYYQFTGHPRCDSCWSLSTGPDGRVYASACSEHTPGQTVKIVRYNSEKDCLDYLFDFDEMVEDPRDSGRATQCKIHYGFVPSMSDGVLYMASHLSGPPFDQKFYSPWRSWHDPKRCFRGSALLAFDTRNDKVLWWDTLLPKEGCRCLLHDEERGLLYALSYPRDRMFVYDLETKKRRDLGRIGSVNSQVLFLDSKHRVWTAADTGHLVRYNPDTDRIEWSPDPLPYDNRIYNGWHNVLYDAVRAPEEEAVYMLPWNTSVRLIRFYPLEGQWGKIEDLGPVSQQHDPEKAFSFNSDHAGGMVFDADGCLYYVACRWPENIQRGFAGKKSIDGVLWRFDPKTGEREEVTVLKTPEGEGYYISRGAVDSHGDLFFGKCLTPYPVGLFRVRLPEQHRKENAHLPIRMWG